MKKVLLILLSLSCFATWAQAPKKMTSTEIYESIQKLNFLGSALYVAAHPDDENTRLIAYLSNEVKANTAYLSLTRGDGGQNLVGPEIRELLGIIRTQELLGARRIDGGQQFFSRANDFGYSKHPDETLKIWNKEEVLGDVVWVMRNFQPDIIVNRFDHRSPGRTHGHHTSSAMLSLEAFDLVGDASAYPDQLKFVDTWQPRRIFFNTSWWFYGSREKFAKADKTRMASVDVGTYYAMRGKSNNEIASESRSMHKSQGFGSSGRRGTQSEYLELIEGDMPTDKENLFEGINTTWSRLEGGAPIGAVLKTVEDNYDFADPSASVAQLVLAYQMLQSLPDSYWKRVKTAELKRVIEACTGMYLEAAADAYSATPGEEVEVEIEAINRADVDVQLKSFSITPMGFDTLMNMEMENNQSYKFFKRVNLPDDIAYSNSYWINKQATLGMYHVGDQAMRGKPETPRSFQAHFDIEVEKIPMRITKDVIYKRTDPVEGEQYRPFEVIPPVFANVENTVYVYANNEPQTVHVVVQSGKDDVKGKVTLARPKGWRIEPEFIEFDLAIKEAETKLAFQLFPPKEQSEGKVTPIVELENGQSYVDGITLIEYDHIPTQTVVQSSTSKVVKIDLEKRGERIGYIMGAGDEIPTALEQIGYQVDLLEDKDITAENLQQYDAVVLGVRAYNTNERIKFQNPILLEYAKQGGTLMVQYNTTRRLKITSAEIGPYPFKLSRDRVSVEEAEVRLLAPEHPVLNTPNKITAADFEGWVQERGLYFPNEWDDNYTAILSSNDPDEPARDGGLLVTKYGEGYYIYSGYSWFRELPAGVPGAFRLFANLVSIGKE